MWRRFLDWLVPGADRPPHRFSARDLLLAGILSLVAASISLQASARINPALYQFAPGASREWFDADHAPILLEVTHDGGTRTGRHPLLLGLTRLPLSALAGVGVPQLTAVRWLLAAWAAVAVSALFLALRGLGLPTSAAALFTGVFLASATFTHWFVILESYPLGAASMSVMLMVLTGADTRWWKIWIAASAGTLAVTVTNWTLAIAAVLFRMTVRNAAVITAAALGVVLILGLLQEAFYPRSALFLGPDTLRAHVAQFRDHADRLLFRSADGSAPSTATVVAARLRVMVLSSAVAPPPELVMRQPGRRTRRIIANQFTPLRAYDAVSWLAAAAWIVLLATGILGGIANRERRRVFGAVGLFLLGQAALHAVFGEASFLYTANWFGALVVLAAFSWFSRYRVAALIAASIFVVFGGWSNVVQLAAAIRLFNSL